MRSRASCLQCGADVEALTYCGVCGASLRASPPAPSGEEPRRVRRPRGLRGLGFASLTIAVGLAAILAALLAGAAGVALAVAAAVPSLLIVIRLTRIDVFEREPVRIWYLVGVAGFVAGILIAIANAWAIERFWFSGATFHAGAAGFSGDVARGEGPPPICALALGGIVFPALGLVLSLLAPVALRRIPALRNEVVDGIMLGAAAGGGFATATAIVYFWPLINGDPAAIGVADGTAMILGVVLVRPVLFALIAALVGAGIWRSALSGRAADLVIPISSGLAGLFVYAVVDLVLMPFGSVVELGWVVLITVALGVIGRRELHRAVRYDRQVLLAGAGRVVCPRCRSVTPAGAFCAACGESLGGAAARDAQGKADAVPNDTAGTDTAEMSTQGADASDASNAPAG